MPEVGVTDVLCHTYFMLQSALARASSNALHVLHPHSCLPYAKLCSQTSLRLFHGHHGIPRAPFLNRPSVLDNLHNISRGWTRRWRSDVFHLQRITFGHDVKTRFFSANSTPKSAVPPLPVLSPPSVGRWLLLSCLLVYGIVVVGGVTRLTESGLSISEWRPITGILPPLTQLEWEEEFMKYQATPEFKLCVFSISSCLFTTSPADSNVSA